MLQRKGLELEIEGQYKTRIAQCEHDMSALKKELAKTGKKSSCMGNTFS